MEPIVALGADGVEPLGGGPAEASTPSLAVMEPIVALGADGVEPLGGKPAEASTPSPAFKLGYETRFLLNRGLLKNYSRRPFGVLRLFSVVRSKIWILSVLNAI